MNKNNEWYTPPHILDRVREVLGSIELDPATCEEAQATVQADSWFTEEDDGLAHEWDVNTLWCNPPYSTKLLKAFTSKFKTDPFLEGIMLTNSGTDTLWNKELADFVQVYTLGRISFLEPGGIEKGKGGRGSVFTYKGNNPQKFIEVFTRDEFCWMPNQCLACYHD